MEVGILLGQNANVLLPTGGTGEYKVDGLRIRRTVLGEYGYVLDGYHQSSRNLTPPQMESSRRYFHFPTENLPARSLLGKQGP